MYLYASTARAFEKFENMFSLFKLAWYEWRRTGFVSFIVSLVSHSFYDNGNVFGFHTLLVVINRF